MRPHDRCDCGRRHRLRRRTQPDKSTDFPLFDPRCCFTDDTVLTIATVYVILHGTSYETAYRDFGRRHPDAGYGGAFYQWLLSAEPRPYNSWGNGSAMRVAPVGLAFTSEGRGPARG